MDRVVLVIVILMNMTMKIIDVIYHRYVINNGHNNMVIDNDRLCGHK